MRARQVTPEDLAEFDYVLAMDRDNFAHLLQLCPTAELRSRIRLFLDFAPDLPEQELPDPYYGGAQGFEHVLDLLDDAKKSGLTLLQGADVPDGGYFIPVTIVDNPPENSRVVQEEAFGPILPMMRFDAIDEVIARATQSEYGLAGAVWTKNVEAGIDIARRMETGTIWVNQNLELTPGVPFAGHKQSGFGVENGMEGLLEFMVPQVINVARA